MDQVCFKIISHVSIRDATLYKNVNYLQLDYYSKREKVQLTTSKLTEQVCILLRRQYIPPLVSEAQDIVLMLKCPNVQAMKNVVS